MKRISLFFCLAYALCGHSQTVGVVLSGGGASGMAHIGVLKALEENNIPIDYITGSSQGALIGAMYAAGYSPLQIEAIVNSVSFKDLSQGIIDKKYEYYFKRNDDGASWVTFKLALDSTLTSVLPTNLMSPIPLDFGLMELFSPSGAIAHYNFDSLFIPFRCLASEIEHKKSIVFSKGNLSEAVRASITYPFYISPIVIDGKLLFDGGLYNNFPSDIMYEEFYPDLIIGSNVGENGVPDENDLFSQVKCMLQSASNYDVLCENGVIIEPKTTTSVLDFSDPQPTIDSGYVAAMRQMELIQSFVERRVTPDQLTVKRQAFTSRAPQSVIDSIYIEGLSKKQAVYAHKIFRRKDKKLTLETAKESYFRLASDDKIKAIYPKMEYNFKTGLYDLHLKVKKEKDIVAQFGGNFSNRPISQGYLGLQYNYLSKFATSIKGNVYFGKLYNSAQIKTRFDFPFRLPIYIEPNLTWNKWDYYKSSNAFLEDVKPAYLKHAEVYGLLNVGFPTGKKGRVVTGIGALSTSSYYYQTSKFSLSDTTDRTNFQALTSQVYYEVNSLNRKQYANQGELVLAKLRYVNGQETTIPGSTSIDTVASFSKFHEWFQLKMQAEKYFNRRGVLKFGFMLEGAYSTQTTFHNYTSSTLVAPAFQPTPDSKTIFLAHYRAYKYLAGGLKVIASIRKNLEVRVEGYVFQPYETLQQAPDLTAWLSNPFAFRYFIGTSAFVWTSPVGPLSLSVNYYNEEVHPVSLLFHFGYIIFNKSALE
jgi:NTE family protein